MPSGSIRPPGRPLPHRRPMCLAALGEQKRRSQPPDKSSPASPCPARIFQISVRAVGRLSNPLSSMTSSSKAMPMARWFAWKRCRHSELGAEDYTNDLDYNGARSRSRCIAVIQLFPPPNAASTFTNECSPNSDRLAKRFPPGMKYRDRFDTTDAVGSIRDVVSNPGHRHLSRHLVIFVFLEDWRSTIIPAVTIPVSLIERSPSLSCWASPSTTPRVRHQPWPPALVRRRRHSSSSKNIERHLQEGEHSPSKPPPTP